MELKLEVAVQGDKTPTFQGPTGGILMVTPPIGEDYWAYRVKLYKDQSIIGFPKFTTIGIGFAQEKDWNTNLPYTSSAEVIAAHIWHNHKYRAIKKPMVIEAIKLIQDYCYLTK